MLQIILFIIIIIHFMPATKMLYQISCAMNTGKGQKIGIGIQTHQLFPTTTDEVVP